MIKFGDLSSYTDAQQKRLEERGGASTINKPKYRDVVTNQDEIDNFNGRGFGGRRGYGSDSHYGNMYEGGNWGQGSSDAEALAKKYGLDRSQLGGTRDELDLDDGHMWGKNPDGSDVYIGKANMDLMSNKELIKNHSTQMDGNEINHFETGTNLSSWGDLAGGLRVELNSGKAPDPITEKQKVEYSPKVQQAMERAAKFENDRNSGKFNDDFYAKYDYKSRDAFNQQSDEYQPIDLNTNVSSIETTGAQTSAQDATKYFLENQKSQLKAKQNFQPIEFRA